MNNHPGGTEQVGGAALAQGGVRGGFFFSLSGLWEVLSHHLMVSES